MLRYCTYCKKDYDFQPLAVSGKENIICPVCGRLIDKNSRRPVDHSDTDQIESGIGSVFATILRIAYVFYIFFAIIGILGFVLHINKILYVATFVVLLAFVIQFFSNTLIFSLGLLFIPIGAIIGYFIFGRIEGAFLGIHIVFLIRHICRDILYTLIFKLIELVKKS